MRQILDAREWLETMRLAHPEATDFIDELINLSELSGMVDGYLELCEELDDITPGEIKTKPEQVEHWRSIEWVNDRLALLEETEKVLQDQGRAGDLDDEVRELLNILGDAETCLLNCGHMAEDGDFLEALFTLAEPKEYDL